jgi:hypothetical protein
VYLDVLTVVRDAPLSQVLEAIEDQADQIHAIRDNNIMEAGFPTTLTLKPSNTRLLAGWDMRWLGTKTMRLKEIYIIARTGTDQVSSSYNEIEALSQIDISRCHSARGLNSSQSINLRSD